MTRPDVEAIRRRVEAATPGPWYGTRVNDDGATDVYIAGADLNCLYHLGTYRYFFWKPGDSGNNRVGFTDAEVEYWTKAKDAAINDAWFIGAARQDLPALLDYIDWLEASLRNIAAHGGAWEKQKALDALKGRPK